MHSSRARPSLEVKASTSWLEHIYYPAAFYACVILFGLTCLVWSLPASLLHHILPRRLGQPLGQFMIMIGFRFFIGVMRMSGVLRTDLSALERLCHERAIVIAPNHPTMLDAVLMMSRLPRVVCITKASIWDNIFYGGSVRLAGYIRNDVPLPMIRRAAQAVRGGCQLLIFPEGSRTTADPVDPFHRSFAVLAKAAGAPVQAVFIEAGSPYLRKGWPLARRPRLPLVYRIRLGPRFEAVGDPARFGERLEACFRAELSGERPA